jgi:signal transduction histidine kinase
MSMSELAEQIGSIGQGEHLCLVYEDAADQLAAVVPYVAEGLRRGEQCVYLADDRSAGVVAAALHDGGVDVAAQREGGALVFITKHDAYLRDGVFRPQQTIAFLRESVAQARADGWSGVRLAGEMTWALDGGADAQQLVEYEALLNDFFPESGALGLCQYNRRRFPGETIYDVLCTHPVAVIDAQLCPNHFYEPPRLVLDQSAKAERARWRIAQLQRARAAAQALEPTSRVEREFLAAMSHDLRTPLNAIIGYAHLLACGRNGELDAEQRRHLARIEANAHNLLAMIDELLAFSRVEAGHEEVEASRITLSRLVNEAADVVRPAADEAGLRLHVETPRRRVVLWTDRSKVGKILLNLLSNAIKYTDAGSITLRARVESNGDDFAVLEVHDTGRGIDSDHLEMIFQPFWRVRGAHVAGTGLGLSVSRRLARMLGGELSVASEPGRGSTFTAKIPLTFRRPPGA